MPYRGNGGIGFDSGLSHDSYLPKTAFGSAVLDTELPIKGVTGILLEERS
jgi:hypothetical protein